MRCNRLSRDKCSFNYFKITHSKKSDIKKAAAPIIGGHKIAPIPLAESNPPAVF